MKIGFDARMIDHPGIGRYIRNLLEEIIPLLGNNELFVFGDKVILSGLRIAASCPAGSAITGEPAIDTALSLRDSCNNKKYCIIDYKAPIYSIREKFSWPFGRYDLDVIHIPHFNLPGIAGKSRRKGKERIIVTIHDLIYTKFPQYLPFVKRALARPIIKYAIEKADRVIAVSENTKNDIVCLSSSAKEKTDIIYEAADPVFRKINDINESRRVKEKYGIKDSFILFVGSLRQHKNINRLIEAYSILKDKGIDPGLVIIGRCHARERDILRKMKDKGVKHIGEIPTEDIAVVYNLAKLFVMPSVYEGFGLPVLEAMACGTAVCCSRAASLPEVAGNAAIMFDPYSVNDMAENMEKVLTDESLRNDLIIRGLSRVNNFSWKDSACKTLRLYDK